MKDLLLRPVTQLQALVVVALVLGGGGIAYGYRHMAVQLLAVVILAFNPGAVLAFFREAPRGFVILFAITIAFPLLQIVPLPPSVWQELPGRELVVQSYSAAEINADSWFSFSIDPLRTLASFCATVAPSAIIAVGWSLCQADRKLLAKTLIALALAAFVLGAVQLTTANTVGVLQRITPDPDVFYATFSNRNSTGIFFVIAALVLSGFPMRSGSIWPFVGVAAGVLMVVAVILTQSRSSMALLFFLLLFLMVRFGATYVLSRQGGEIASLRPALIGSGLLGALAILAIGFSIASGGRAAQSIERFEQIDGDRLEMWDDGAFVASRYFPAGAGTGTFDEVFQIDESLAYVSPARAGRAHNDYIELVIETGVAGPLILLAWFAWLGSAVWQRRRDADGWLAFAAWTSFVCIALQSVLDYPMRNLAMLCVAAVLLLLLLPAREKAR